VIMHPASCGLLRGKTLGLSVNPRTAFTVGQLECLRAQSNAITIDTSVARLCVFPSLDISDGDAGTLFPCVNSGMEEHRESSWPRTGLFFFFLTG